VIASGLHSGGGLEPVDQVGQRYAVDARDDLMATEVFPPLEIEPELVAGWALFSQVALTSIRMGCLKLWSGGYQQSNLEGETAMTDPNPIYTELLAEREAAETDSDGDQDTMVDAE
jgi:hypothetical protein